jgi:hypothetical protein
MNGLMHRNQISPLHSCTALPGGICTHLKASCSQPGMQLFMIAGSLSFAQTDSRFAWS